jgi:hypothetical protein
MSAVFQHKRMRNNCLLPMFCASSDAWGGELHRVLLRVFQRTEITLLSENIIKNSPLSLPCSAIQQLIRVLQNHGMYSLVGTAHYKVLFDFRLFRECQGQPAASARAHGIASSAWLDLQSEARGAMHLAACSMK